MFFSLMFVYRFLMKVKNVLINLSQPSLMSTDMTTTTTMMMMMMMTVAVDIQSVKAQGTQQTVTHLLYMPQMLGLNLYLQEENYIL